LKRGNLRFIANVAVLLALLAAMSLPVMAQDQDVVTQARQLAYSGKEHRDQALVMLKAYLDKQDDSDARTLYGTILSWQGRYDEARAQLAIVLAKSPTHGDALPAALNVEFWSGHPENADQLARTALAKEPDNVQWMLAEAKALRQMNRGRDADAVLDRVLVVDSRNKSAKTMRHETTEDFSKRPEVAVSYAYDWFSDNRGPQHESTISFKEPTRLGSVIATTGRADRFGLSSYQTQLDFYPHIRPGMYANINVGYSHDANLYPRYRVGVDLFQSLGHGFEVSGGYRHLGFTNSVDIYTFSVSKYYHSFLFTGRGYLVPGSTGLSGTGAVSARYFLGSEGTHDYIEVGYHYGASPTVVQTITNISVLSSNKWLATYDKTIHHRFGFQINGSAGRVQQTISAVPHLWQFEVGLSLYYRF